MPEIKPSGTDWDTAPKLTEWERHYIAGARLTMLGDFDDADTVAEKPIRLTYMGAGPAEDVGPRLLDHENVSMPADRQVTAWRLRYPEPESLEISTKPGDGNGQTATFEGSNVELFRSRMYVRPGVPAALMLGMAAIWCRGFQVGKRKMNREKRSRLYRQFHELLGYALENMPQIDATPKEHEDMQLDVRDDVLERLEEARDEMTGAYHVDLPAFTVEVDEDEEDAPAPRESPNPFDMATGLAKVPSGEFTRGNLRGISGEGEWLEDSFGRPVYRYTFQGPPWGGNAQLSVKQAIETDAAWKMLRDGKGEDRPTQFHADAVTLYYLFLAYASDQAPKNRPGPDEGFRIRGEDVLRILNLPDNGEWDRQRKVRHIYNLNSYLNSFQIQLNRITYQGERKRTDAISPAQLWDTYLRGVEKKDLHGNVTNIEFSVEGREGAWADLFLHDSDTWTPFGSLPIRVLEDMDGRNRYSRLILFHILILFRVEGGTVRRTGDDLLKWCRVVPDKLSRQQISRRRSTIQNALEELKQQGFQIDDSRLRAAKGTPLSDWQGQAVHFYPPPDIVDACPQIEAPEGQLPEPRSETWTGKRVRDLRKHIGEYQSEFGGRLPNREGGMGVKQPRVSTIESGNHPLTERQEKKLDELAKEFGFDG
jgi:hypothetical protein